MISKPILKKDIAKKGRDILQSLKNVPINHNPILDAILAELSTISPNIVDKTFMIAPDNKYKIRIRTFNVIDNDIRVTLALSL
jgi:hypothetical protein